MKILTIGKIVSRIAVIIAVVEVFLMLILGNIPHEMDSGKLLFSHLAWLSFLNAIFLVLFASPLIYFLVVKPFVDERDTAMAKITYLAHYDPLTQLANRRLINQNLKTLIAHCVRQKTYGALVMIDLDKFKPINDNYGHDAGDAVLIEIAKRLTTALREVDVVGRIGGDEFVILVDHLGTSEQSATEKVNLIVDKLSAVIMAPIEYKGESLQVSSSIGISLFCAEKITLDTVFKMADIAMYQAKKSTIKHIIYSEL